MSTRSPRNKLHVTTTDPEASLALVRTQLRAQGYPQPRRTTTLSARVSLASRDAVRSVARRMGISTSTLLGLLVDGIAAPGGAAAKVLEEIAKLLALPAGSSVDDILVAIGALGDELDGDSAPADGAAPADPLEGAAEAPPAQLSRAPAGGRTFTTSGGAVTLSASEIENCKEMGATLEAYAENKALRDAARRPARREQARRR